MTNWIPAAQRGLTRLLLAFALVSIGFAAGKHAAQTHRGPAPAAGAAAGAGVEPSSAVVVYYMHATFRCATCNRIETMTRALLDTEFAEHLKAGTVRMETVNFQENEVLAKQYEVVASCVVLVHRRNGAEIAFERLDGVWTLMKDPDAFNRYVGDAVRGYLAGPEAQP